MSKLALGTVQFGLDYGVTNQSGQVAIKEVGNILDLAKDNGIDTLDTASCYGNSEQILGKVGVDNYKVITKTISLENGISKVINGFYQSLNRLDQKQVEGLLIHNIKDIKDKQFDMLFSKLNELKQQGLIKKIGFSTSTPGQVDFLLENFDFDLIQVPFNVFDTRLIDGGQLSKLKNKKIEIHARSIFLQGILVNLGECNGYFSTWKKEFDEYREIVEKNESTLLEYAINYVLSVPEIDKALFGVSNIQQLIEIFKSIHSDNIINVKAFSINNINLLNPSLWKV